MKKDQTPQDQASTYAGNKKLLYAVDEQGSYETVTSSGWEVEELVTSMAVKELLELAEEARQQVLAGEKSPLFFWMYKARLDTLALSQATGFFRWRIRRHFKPAVFAKLKEPVLKRYSEVIGVSIEQLKTVDHESI